ncbi:MAG TPA: TetR/AcrR family transcriptional regulator [Xanthobacteraceae bacterium]|nr:TetR/AcrR family transcriptional regulator [Xanthobacteraceae bacterium]
MKRRKAAPLQTPDGSSESPLRARILRAAFSAFMERGFEGTSTLKIATRAKVSKRELYALFDNKQAILGACIAERTRQMRLPLELAVTDSAEALVTTLTAYGTAILRGVCHPTALATYRLAIAESDRSPEVARMLDKAGREANYRELTALLTRAHAYGLVGAGDPAAMAEQFLALLGGGLLPRLLLRVAIPPNPAEIERRAQAATRSFMILNGKEL